MSLLGLPDELLLCIASHLSSLRDINSMVKTNRHLYHSLNRLLYELSIEKCEQFTLPWCAWHGSLNHVLVHLEMGASSLDEALYAATVGWHYEIMEALVQSGANVNARMRNGFTPLHAAACVNPFVPHIETLLDNGADLNTRTEGMFGGYNALHLASALGNLFIVELLLDRGMDIESLTTSTEHVRITPLTCAIRGFHEADINDTLCEPLGFLPRSHRLVPPGGTVSVRRATTQHLLDRNANLDGGSLCSRPRRYFRAVPGETLRAAHCNFDDYLPMTNRHIGYFL